MIPKEDEVGFDPFAEPDPFREEHPEHDIKSVGELLPQDLLRPWEPGDPPRPQSQQVKCCVCHKDFMAKAVWFHKWHIPDLCLDCADGNSLPPGFLSESKRPPILQMSCLSCGVTRGVEGTLRGNLWRYESTCANCGYVSMQFPRRIRRACVDCGEGFFVSEKRPLRVCHKCAQKTSASGQY